MAVSLKGIVLFIFCFLLAACSPSTQGIEFPPAVDGSLDLHNWDFEANAPIPLKGEWEFYWQELLAPSEIGADSSPMFVRVPDSWTNYEINGQELPAGGYATYRLTVSLPQTSKAYGLYIDGEGTAYTLWIDGNIVVQDGRVADNSHEMIPQSTPHVVFFETNGDTTDFVIQISNFHHRKAGFRNEFLLGTPSQIHKYQSDLVARDTFIMGIYLVIVLYHIAIYWFRPVNKSPLYFAIWSLMLFVRASLLNQKALLFLLPAIHWSAALRVEYFTFYFISAIYILFIQSLYPEDIDPWMTKLTVGLSSAFTVYMLSVDTLTASYTVTPYQGILLLEILYFITFIRRIIIRKREGALYIAAASAIGFTGMVVEILSLQNILMLKIDALIAFMAFVFIQAILLSNRLSKSFQRVEALSVELEEANLSLLESEIKYRTIFEDTKDMIFIADLKERILDVNPAGEELLGYEWTNFVGMRMADLLVNPEDRSRIAESLTKETIIQDEELELRKKNGEVVHGLVTLALRRDDDGKITGIQGHVHDLSARKQAEHERTRAIKFEQLSITDPLTKVYNRRFFDEVAGKEWERSKRSGAPLSIVIFDIDHFKKINDTYGHLNGDKILTSLARLCQENMRSMDIFARYGGEEFVILMPDANRREAYESMERLREMVASIAMVKTQTEEIKITISIGIASRQDGKPNSVSKLLDHADHALYHSKEAGRNQTSVWDGQ